MPSGPEPEPAVGGPPSAPPPPSQPAYPLWLVVGVLVLALVGIGLLGLGIYAVARMTASPAPAAATAPSPPAATLIVLIPTTTPQPTATATASPEPTRTEVAASPTPGDDEATAAAEDTAEPEASVTPDAGSITTKVGANVRGGPGTNYPTVGALEQGASAPVVGRNAGGTWFVIEFSRGFGGEGWISGQVVDFAGDLDDLPVIAAPPPPAPTATPRPASNPAPGPIAGSHGLSGQLTMCGGRLSFAVNERVCFVEMIRNNSTAAVGYGVLGVIAVNPNTGATQFQSSWDGQGAEGGWLWIDPGCVGPTDRCNGQWEDGMRIGTPGSWRLTLQVCFSDFGACLNGGDWETLSAPITISVN